MNKLIGLFGGTFDPVHLGHINAVNQLSERLNFDRVHWVLSARPPHKDAATASIKQRFEMLQIAIAEYPNYVADDCEIARQKKSYMFDTVQIFQQRYVNDTLCLIIGADSLSQLPYWYRYQELIDSVHIIVMARPGYELAIPERLREHLLTSIGQMVNSDTPGLVIFEHSDFNISATAIRSLLTKESPPVTRKKLKQLLPESVIDYIHEHQSYKLAPDNFEEKMKPDQIKNRVLEALKNIKGQDIRVIDIKDISDFADYMVVVSGTSDTHVKALAREASDSLRKQGVIPLGETGADIGEWILIDFGDVVLHVMRPEVREYYDLEKLWDEDVRELVRQHREQQEG